MSGSPGHRLCGGCGIQAVRQALAGSNDYDVVRKRYGLLWEVSTTIFLITHGTFRSFTMRSRILALSSLVLRLLYKGLQRAGKIPADRKIKFVAFGGDGGTYDIGLFSSVRRWSAARMSCGVRYDNGAYMNTGIQRSSATPKGAWATTEAAG